MNCTGWKEWTIGCLVVGGSAGQVIVFELSDGGGKPQLDVLKVDIIDEEEEENNII